MDKPIIYWSTLATISTFKDRNGQGCMIESGDLDKLELYTQFYRAKTQGARGHRVNVFWSMSRMDRNCTPFMFDEEAIKGKEFDLFEYNPKYKKALIEIIKAACGKHKEDYFQFDMFCHCGEKYKKGKYDFRIWNPWYRNKQRLKGWWKNDEETVKARESLIDWLLDIMEPMRRAGYKILYGKENEPPAKNIPALIDNYSYMCFSGIPYENIVPGVQFKTFEDLKPYDPFRIYKNWRKAQPDEMKIERSPETAHNIKKSGFIVRIIMKPENIGQKIIIILSLDGEYIKIGDKEIYPTADENYEFFLPLFKQIKVSKRHKKIIENKWPIEVLGWGNAFDGNTIEGLSRAWEKVFGVSLRRKEYEELPVFEPEIPEEKKEEPIKPNIKEENKVIEKNEKKENAWKCLTPKPQWPRLPIKIDFKGFFKESNLGQKLIFIFLFLVLLIIAIIIIF